MIEEQSKRVLSKSYNEEDYKKDVVRARQYLKLINQYTRFADNVQGEPISFEG